MKVTIAGSSPIFPKRNVMKTKLVAFVAVGLIVSAWLLINFRNNAAVYKNTIDMTFVRIQGGSFGMGYENDKKTIETLEGYYSDFLGETYYQQVTINQTFWMSQFEVTHEQFRRFADDTGYLTDNETTGRSQNWRVNDLPMRGDHPVTNVSCNDAIAFCKWLSEKEGKHYRLPTEAEWEFACRGGTTTLFSFGDDPSLFPRYGNIADERFRNSDLRQTRLDLQHNYSCPWNDGYEYVAPVGSYLSNALGLYDMHGNVSEICSDSYRTYVNGEPDRTYLERCVVRGGCWGSWEMLSTSFYRHDQDRGFGTDKTGFRVVLEQRTMSKPDLDE
jgi:formylglycine-generating enzyme